MKKWTRSAKSTIHFESEYYIYDSNVLLRQIFNDLDESPTPKNREELVVYIFQKFDTTQNDAKLANDSLLFGNGSR